MVHDKNDFWRVAVDGNLNFVPVQFVERNNLGRAASMARNMSFHREGLQQW